MFSSLLQKAGFRPGLALHSTIPKLLMAAAVAGGAVSLLGAGSARATTWVSKCLFTVAQTQCLGTTGAAAGWTIEAPGAGPGVPPLQLGDKLLEIKSYSFNSLATGTPAPLSGFFTFSWDDASTAPIFSDDNWSVRTVFDTVASGSGAVNATGSLNYTLAIVGSTTTFDTVRLDSATTGLASVVTKAIAGVLPSPLLTSTAGSSSFASIGGTLVDVTDIYSVPTGSGLNGFNNGYTQTGDEVPGPLPVLGAGMAFGFSRKLRSRIKASAKA